MNTDRFKYRIFDIDNNYYVKIPEKGRIPDAIVSPNGDIWGTDYDELFSTYSRGYIVEQCTGFKDKNGKLLYEGDLVRLVSSPLICKVVYQDGCFWLDYETALYKVCHKIEIIGNIHEMEGK